MKAGPPRSDHRPRELRLPPLRHPHLDRLHPEGRGAFLEHEDPLGHGAPGPGAHHPPHAGPHGHGAPVTDVLLLLRRELGVRHLGHQPLVPPPELLQEEGGGVVTPGAVKHPHVAETVWSDSALSGRQRQGHPLFGLVKSPSHLRKLRITDRPELIKKIRHRGVLITWAGARGQRMHRALLRTLEDRG